MARRSAPQQEPPSSRTSNELECALAYLSTWYGQPRVAGSLIIDPAGPMSVLRGEVTGRDRAEAWIGGRFEYLGPDSAAYELVADRLIVGGHGTAAVIVNGWPPHLGTRPMITRQFIEERSRQLFNSSPSAEGPVEVGIYEFDLGFVVWPVEPEPTDWSRGRRSAAACS